MEDLRQVAKRRVPRMFYDYVDSGSYTESTYRANEVVFQKILFRLRVAVDMPNRSTRTTMLGRSFAYGLGAYGQPGVSEALPILHKKLETSMALCGHPQYSKSTAAFCCPHLYNTWLTKLPGHQAQCASHKRIVRIAHARLDLRIGTRAGMATSIVFNQLRHPGIDVRRKLCRRLGERLRCTNRIRRLGCDTVVKQPLA